MTINELLKLTKHKVYYLEIHFLKNDNKISLHTIESSCFLIDEKQFKIMNYNEIYSYSYNYNHQTMLVTLKDEK